MSAAIEKLKYRLKMSEGRPISDDPVVREVAEALVELEIKFQTMWRMYMEDE